jgi:hypothetical protein
MKIQAFALAVVKWHSFQGRSTTFSKAHTTKSTG